MNKKIFIRGVLCLLITLLAAEIFAFDVEDTLKVYESQDTIVVVADRFALPLKNITYTHQIIPKQMIHTYSDHSALQLVDMVFPSAYTLDKKVIGYGVGSEGGGSINIRGQGGRPNTGILVLINGHPDFMSLFGHPLPDVYGTDDIQQVEILAGPTSTVFGSQAMAGVINIKTRPDYSKWLRLSLEGGSYDTYNVGLNINQQFEKGGLFISTRHKKTSGHFANTSFQSLHVQAGLEYNLSEIWRISMHGRYVPYQFDDPVLGDSDPANLGTYAKIKRGTGELILENKTKYISGSTQVYGNWGQHLFSDGFDSHDYTYGFSSYQQWKSSDVFSLAAGADLIYFGGKAQNDLVPPGLINEKKQSLNSAGIYALGFYNGLAKFNFKFGIRYQHNSLPLQNISPVLGAMYSIIPQLKIYANYQNGFRYPTLNELYLFPPANAELKDENINSIECGLWYYWGRKNIVRLTYYYNDVDNIIQLLANTTPPPPMRYANSGSAKQQGVETQLTLRLMDDLGLHVTYSYLDPDQITAFNPKHQFKYLLMYHLNLFHISIYGKYIDKLYAANEYQQSLPDYHVLNMMLSMKLAQGDFYVKLQNVLDRLYYVYYVSPDFPYPAPKFHVLAGVKFEL
jgi:outer membrane cobalamin receptor